MTEHTTSYYAASANKYEPFPTLEGSINCDVCVVGGGYTGLSSALHLAEMGYDVVVLEGARIGFGASGRNGGQLVNSYSRDIDVIEKTTARMRQNARQHDVRRRRYYSRTHPALSDPVRLPPGRPVRGDEP
jgi:flavin-dependent dehydrogenase